MRKAIGASDDARFARNMFRLVHLAIRRAQWSLLPVYRARIVRHCDARAVPQGRYLETLNLIDRHTGRLSDVPSIRVSEVFKLTTVHEVFKCGA